MVSFANVFAILAFNILTSIFWFAGFVALAVLVQDIRDTQYIHDTYGGARDSLGKWCGIMTAALVFSFFQG